MDTDIQFGDVEEAGPEVQLRPDQNPHYAIVPVHDPGSADLPIYVDVDVMRDMEAHALTDTSVELGGVMLGGQFEDDEGNPFVVITDSLRAEHYEATKGSFKFTHETWQQISRQRDEFPDDLQMVGWYHTHPDWGVFLSGMDMFICDNFFNRPLDLALVIDPCRGDRGWFHWITDSNERIRRTDGFFLIGSRFRQAELEYFAFQLKGKLTMASDYRGSGIAGSVGSPVAPVVNISDSRGSGSNLGMLALLSMQFLFLGVIAWKLLFGGPDKDALEELKKEVAGISKQKMSDQKIKVLEKALTLSGGSTQIAQLLEEKEDYQIRLEDSIAKRTLLVDQNKGLNTKNRILEAENGGLKKDLRKKKDEVANLKKDIKELKAEDGDAVPFWKNSTLVLFVGALGFICGVAGGTVGFMLGRLRGEDDTIEERFETMEITDEPEDSGQDQGGGDELGEERGSENGR